MASVSKPTRRVKPATESACGTCRWAVWIQPARGEAAWYSVRPIPPGPDGELAFTLVNQTSGESYTVSQDEHGVIRCECPDFEFRRSKTGTLCKHAMALSAIGLVWPNERVEMAD